MKKLLLAGLLIPVAMMLTLSCSADHEQVVKGDQEIEVSTRATVQMYDNNGKAIQFDSQRRATITPRINWAGTYWIKVVTPTHTRRTVSVEPAATQWVTPSPVGQSSRDGYVYVTVNPPVSAPDNIVNVYVDGIAYKLTFQAYGISVGPGGQIVP